MTLLFQRESRIQVGTLVLTGMRVSFKISKSLKRNPNKCEIKIYNLNASHRAQIEQARTTVVKVEAGYKGSSLSTYFLGDLRDGSSTRDGVNIITTLNNGDGERRSRTARSNRSFSPGTRVGDVISRLVGDLGLDPGNAVRELANATLGNGMSFFAEGTTTQGNAHDQLDRLVNGAGYEMSVQSGTLQVMRRGAALPTTAVVLDSDSGLVGSPTISNKGVVKFRSLLNSDITPGRLVTIRSLGVNGTYRVEKLEISADTGGPDWHVVGEAK